MSDLIPSIRKQGVLQPLLVRKNCEGYEVIAGGRRLKACQTIASEGGEAFPPVPCAEIEDGDDAAAIEASLAENIARLPMDEIDQHQAFAALIAQGRSVEDIADHFGVTERLVRQRLAIANLIPPILTLFRKEEITGETMRALTLATKTQQKAWLKRFRDPGDYAPQGRELRHWLLGGQQIATTAALFPLESYKGGIVSDLFGEEAYFADPEAFWTLQRQAIAEREAAYLDKGWSEVVVLEQCSYWPSYEYAKTAKKDGGRIYVSLSYSGEAAFHEGYLPVRELRKRERQSAQEGSGDEAKADKPDLTKAAQNYVDLHRHAAVGAVLLTEPGIALRVMVAHAVAGSTLWRVEADPCRADKPETAASLSKAKAAIQLAEEERTVLGLLGRDEGGDIMARYGEDADSVFQTLLGLEDDAVMRVLTLVMAKSLTVGSSLIDTLGTIMSVGMEQLWEADDALLDLIRSRETSFAMLEEVGGKAVAEAHRASPAKLIRSIVRQYATGEGREKAEGWVPRFLRFPAGSYRKAA